MLQCAHFTLNYVYYDGTPCINNCECHRVHSVSRLGQFCQDSRKQVLHVSMFYTKLFSLRSGRFQKLTRRERNWEGVRKIRSRVLFSPPPPHSRSLLPHFSPIFCSPQACSFSSPLFRSLVRSPPGKGKEMATTQAKYS